MKKIFNFVMVMCLAFAALTLTFAVCLPGSKASGANVSKASAAAPTANFETVGESGTARQMFAAADYQPFDGSANRASVFNRQPVTVDSLIVRQRKFLLPNHNLPPNQSLFDTPLFKNSKNLKPSLFSRNETRSFPLRR